MLLVHFEFKYDVSIDHHAYTDGHCQTEDINERRHRIFKQATPGGF